MDVTLGSTCEFRAEKNMLRLSLITSKLYIYDTKAKLMGSLQKGSELRRIWEKMLKHNSL